MNQFWLMEKRLFICMNDVNDFHKGCSVLNFGYCDHSRNQCCCFSFFFLKFDLVVLYRRAQQFVWILFFVIFSNNNHHHQIVGFTVFFQQKCPCAIFLEWRTYICFVCCNYIYPKREKDLSKSILENLYLMPVCY